jgi:hypothetical protein
MLKKLYLSIFTIFLCACGGGSSDPLISAPVTVNPPVTLATDSFKGSWVGGCASSEAKVGSINGIPLFQQAYLSSTSNSNSSITYSVSIKFFAGADSNCSGSVVGVIGTETFTPLTFTFDGQTTISGQVVEKVTSSTLSSQNITMYGSTVAVSSINTGSVYSLNNVFFPVGYFSNEPSEKGLLRVDGTQLFCDDGSGTATVYPTGITALPCFVKQ